MSTFYCSSGSLTDLDRLHTEPVSLNFLKICLSALLEGICFHLCFCKSILIKITDYNLAISSTSSIRLSRGKIL